ncbi:MAG: hypothetical protein ACJ741_16040 [Pyrinomonadaceae bacterium]
MTDRGGCSGDWYAAMIRLVFCDEVKDWRSGNALVDATSLKGQCQSSDDCTALSAAVKFVCVTLTFAACSEHNDTQEMNTPIKHRGRVAASHLDNGERDENIAGHYTDVGKNLLVGRVKGE